LRPDSLDIKVLFSQAAGDLDVVPLPGLQPGACYVHVYGVGGAMNTYGLSVDPGAGSTTRVFYVNDSSLANDFYATATGNDTNDGLTPATPKATVQDVLADYVLGPNDLVLIDTGTYSTGVITIGTADQGAAYAGSPGGSSFGYSRTRFDLSDSDANLLHGLRFTGTSGTGVYAHGGATRVRALSAWDMMPSSPF
jgi:hypothetical protein